MDLGNAMVYMPEIASRRQSRRLLCLGLLCAALSASRLNAQNVLTYHNDNARTGQNLNEHILSPRDLSSSIFGKLFVIRVDGKVDAEPLYARRLDMPHRGAESVLFVATEHDSVYAFNADTGKLFWRARLLKPGETPSDPRNCTQVIPEIGVTSTPVIDLASGPHGTIYSVAMSRDAEGHYFQRLHALDLSTGAEEFGGPVAIQASFPGNGMGSRNGKMIFDPKQYEERAALLLSKGVIYTTWASHCDADPYSGWMMGYDEHNLSQTSVINFTPNGGEGAVWQSGNGPAADAEGNIYLLDGNGTFDTKLNSEGFPEKGDFGNSFLKLAVRGDALSIVDYFAMHNIVRENATDLDLGSGGLLLLPNMADSSGRAQHLAVGAGKDRNIYIVNRDAMGKFNPESDLALYQQVDNVLGDGEFASPAYFDGRLYYGAVNDHLKEFQFIHARLHPAPVAETPEIFTYPGTTPSISAEGSRNGIVWVAENGDRAVLRAFDANDLSDELYNSNQQPSGRDYFGIGNKFITPMIAHGKVYVGTTAGVAVFGLLRSAHIY
ncbi:MAG: pyrrolo-quinoline quinone [Terriglobia bacterium]